MTTDNVDVEVTCDVSAGGVPSTDVCACEAEVEERRERSSVGLSDGIPNILLVFPPYRV